MSYIPRQHYTDAELDDAAIRDQLNDARCSEEQAAEGPFYPERGITRESLLAYAAKCRATAAKYADGGCHKAVLGNSLAEDDSCEDTNVEDSFAR